MIQDIELKDVDIIFSNRGLWPWEGGCLWQKEGEKPLIQLRKVFQKKERYLWIYSRKEILNHEAVHAKRINYNEPRFEEILAYQTSSSKFRRFFGPIFRNSKESLIFVICSLSTFFTPYLFLIVSAFFFIRLFRNQWIFSKVKKKLTFRFGDELQTYQYLISLKDKEIINYYKLT